MQNKLISAIGAAATDYFHAAYYKTGTADFYEGKAKGLLNLAADLGLYDHPDIVRYRKTVTDADEIIKAKGLLNLAADLGLYDHPDIVRYRKTVTDADEIIQANKAAADREKG